MPTGFLSVLLLVLFLIVAFRVILSLNRDLFRARAWKELARKMLPLGALALMAATLPLIQNATTDWIPVVWAVVLGGSIVLANFFSMSSLERRASRHFRRGRYEEAVENFRALTEEKPYARYYAFLGAALGANAASKGDSAEGSEPQTQGSGSGISQRLQESIDTSTKAIELDPDYGVAYYNRALTLRRAGRRGKATKDMQRALEADLPRRFRSAAQRYLEGDK